MEHTVNEIRLRGSLGNLPEFSHENHGRKFYRFHLEVPRLSGAVDTLPVIASESILNRMDLSGGEMLTVSGSVRSYNCRVDGVRHLMIFVFANDIVAEDGEPINEVTVEGPLCKELLTGAPPWAGRSAMRCWRFPEPFTGQITSRVFYGAEPLRRFPGAVSAMWFV